MRLSHEIGLDPARIEVIILAGGKGTRLRPAVSDRPKVLAEVAGRPFLAWIIDRLSGAGFRHVVLATGYMAEKVEFVMGKGYRETRLSYSREEEPLDTGGAVRLAAGRTSSAPVLVLNGDSFVAADHAAVLAWFARSSRPAGMLLTRMRDASRFGLVHLASDGTVQSFQEKREDFGPGLVSAGAYLLRRTVLDAIPPACPCSLEREVFPRLVAEGALSGFPVEGILLDIGTPESLDEARRYFTARPFPGGDGSETA
jgi:D-glycero-alpha-D-manno-heptose 1-phosphate guanylyltransferase